MKDRHRDTIFFGLLHNPRVPSTGLSTMWYQLKWSFYYFKRFFYEIWWFRGSDRGYTFNLLETALEEHLRSISTPSNFQERDEERIPKENAIKRCLEILRNVDEDNYAERCGYTFDYDFYFVPVEDKEGYSEMKTTATPEQDERNSRALKEGYELAEEEFQELMQLLGDPKKGIRTWWK